MAKGFGGLPGNMQAIMQQAKKMQDQLKKAQDEAKDMTESGSSGGGMVEVVANGENQILSISIKKEIINPDDVEMLQDLILTACNNALSKVQKSVQEKLASITGGMNLPGMF